jgi:hypothetical protein
MRVNVLLIAGTPSCGEMLGYSHVGVATLARAPFARLVLALLAQAWRGIWAGIIQPGPTNPE